MLEGSGISGSGGFGFHGFHGFHDLQGASGFLGFHGRQNLPHLPDPDPCGGMPAKLFPVAAATSNDAGSRPGALNLPLSAAESSKCSKSIFLAQNRASRLGATSIGPAFALRPSCPATSNAGSMAWAGVWIAFNGKSSSRTASPAPSITTPPCSSGVRSTKITASRPFI